MKKYKSLLLAHITLFGFLLLCYLSGMIIGLFVPIRMSGNMSIHFTYLLIGIGGGVFSFIILLVLWVIAMIIKEEE